MLIDLRRLFHKDFKKDPTPKKALTLCQDLSDIGADFVHKAFFGVGSLDFRGSNPEESPDTSPRPVRQRC